MFSAFARRSLQPLHCLFDRHDPDRTSLYWDGTHYAATCRACGRPIRRHAHKVWKDARAR